MTANKLGLNPSLNSLLICIPVWGDSFVAKFIDYTLATLLNDIDVDFFKRHHVELHLFTRTHDQIKLSSIDFATFGLNAIYHHIDEEISKHAQGRRGEKYRILNYCHELGMQIAIQKKQAYMPLVSDVVVSKGAIRYAFEKIQEGYLAVFVGTIRVISEIYETKFSAISKDTFNGWQGYEIVDIALDDLHSKVDMTTVNTLGFDYTWPDSLYWLDQTQGLVQKGLFLHPFIFLPNRSMSLDMHTIDVNLEGLPIEESYSNIYVVGSSDELVCASLCDRNEFEHIKIEDNKRFEIDKLGEFLAFDSAVKPLHFYFLNRSIYFKRNIESKLDCLNVEATECVEKILQSYHKFHKLKQAQGLSSTQNRLLGLMSKYENGWLRITKQKVNELVELEGIKEMVVYGFGEHSELLLNFTNIKPYIAAFSDSNPDLWGQYKQGIRCVSPQEIPLYSKDILISSREYETDIESALLKLFGNQLRIFKLYDNNRIMN